MVIGSIMKKKVLTIILAALCVLTCAFSACEKKEPDDNPTTAGEFVDPAMDDIYA